MEFILNNRSSKNFNFKIKETNHLLKPKKRLKLISIPGRTGDLIIDEGSRENFNLIITGYLDVKGDIRGLELVEVINELDKWLNSTTGYQTMEFDDGTVLKVVSIGDIDPQYIVKNFSEITLEFSAYREVD